MWDCICDCGKCCTVLGDHLRSGHTISCGCYNLEKSIEANKKFNTFDLSGDYGIGFTNKQEDFYFDLEDYEKIKKYCWYMSHGYIYAQNSNLNGGGVVSLHRLIMDCNDKNFIVDHINHNTSDNRKSNLRIVTKQQNAMNQSLRTNNISGVTGIHFVKEQQKWWARIKHNNKTINLGLYEDFSDAVKARKEAEDKYFGEYSYRKSMEVSIEH